MPKIPLRVIPEPEEGTRAVLVFGGEGTTFARGSATGHDYVCGACGAVLLEGTSTGPDTDVVLKCAACGAFNDTAPMHA